MIGEVWRYILGNGCECGNLGKWPSQFFHLDEYAIVGKCPTVMMSEELMLENDEVQQIL